MNLGFHFAGVREELAMRFWRGVDSKSLSAYGCLFRPKACLLPAIEVLWQSVHVLLQFVQEIRL
jgi:hypothetical protein